MVTISRRRTLGLGLGAGLSVTMLSGRSESSPGGRAPDPTFSLLLVNDIYRMSDQDGHGGFARLAAVVKAERARGVPMLFCHAGDTFSPSLMSGLDQGAAIVELTNMAAPDVFVPGNHEFDFGPQVFAQRMEQARFPFFAANLRQADGSPVPGVRDSILVGLGGIAVGVVGLALAATPRVSQAGDLRFLPELDVLAEQVKHLRADGAEFLVAVAHTPRDLDEAIVRSGLVDVLLSGHDHDLAIGYDGNTVMVESSEEGYFVTAIDFAVQATGEGRGRKLSWHPSFRVHESATIVPDPQVQAAVTRLEGELAHDLDVPVGIAASELDSRNIVVRTREATIGDLVADALRTAMSADVAIVNGGGIRGNRLYPAGTTLTRRDILTELPFGNTTVLVAMDARGIEAALENGVSQLEDAAGRFPQVSGLTFELDPGAPAGSRVRNLAIGGEPPDPRKSYKVASSNFLLAGGDGYTALAHGKVLVGATDGKLLANVVMAYIRHNGTVPVPSEARVIIR